MKRVGWIYEEVYELKNLYSAYGKAAKGKGKNKDVVDFNKNLELNLSLIQKDLLEKNWQFGDYTYFKIYEPKERLITAASFRERVIHHALMNVCDVQFEKVSLNCSYACRKNMGMHKAVAKAQEYSQKSSCYLKLDIRKYFDSISHDILLQKLNRLYKDPHLIDCFKGLLEINQSPKGLPIGNLTSQYFANYYLTFLDRYIKEKLLCKNYLRYMDDFLLFSDDKKKLKNWKEKIELFLNEELELKLKDNTRLNFCSRGILFLGYIIRPNNLQLNRRSRKRFIHKFRWLQNSFMLGQLSSCEYGQRVDSLYQFTSRTNLNFNKGILKKYEMSF